ncbi:MAG: hypothetical protein ACRCW2_13645 [Cellulosilyticaceae bacterium]
MAVEGLCVIGGMVFVLIGGCNLIAHLGLKKEVPMKGIRKYTRNMKLMGSFVILGILLIGVSTIL